MAQDSKTYPQVSRDRIKGGMALTYILDVVEGAETAPDKVRLDACFKVLAKVLPDLKAVEVTGEVDHKVELTWKS